MAPERARPATSRKGERATGVIGFQASRHARHSHPNRRPQPAGGVFAITAVPREISREDQADVMVWVAERRLPGLARRRGYFPAAAEAHRMADLLGGVR